MPTRSGPETPPITQIIWRSSMRRSTCQDAGQVQPIMNGCPKRGGVRGMAAELNAVDWDWHSAIRSFGSYVISNNFLHFPFPPFIHFHILPFPEYPLLIVLPFLGPLLFIRIFICIWTSSNKLLTICLYWIVRTQQLATP